MSVKARGKVILNLEIYKTIIASTVRYANATIPEKDWAEVYGLLYGYVQNDNAIITAAVPFTHTQKVKRILKVEFSEQDYVDAAEIETEMMVEDPPKYIMGWYHSHPGIKVMLSQDDVRTQLSWQEQNPHAIALVFNHKQLLDQVELPARKGDPVKPLKDDLGFRIYRLDNPSKGLEAQYHEVPFEFSDLKVDSTLVKNAQEFVGYVTKAFPRGDEYVLQADKFVSEQSNKVGQLLVGTVSYVQTLLKQGNSERVASVLDMQRGEIQKAIDFGNEKTSLYQMLLPYVEYKERADMIPKIQEILARWTKKVTEIGEIFEKLQKDPPSVTLESITQNSPQ